MRAIVIDPAARSVREVEVDGTLESIQALVGGYIEAIYPAAVDPAWGGDHLYLDEEGRLKPEVAGQRWTLHKWQEPFLCGPGVVLSDGGSGDEAPAQMSLEALRARVRFL